MVLQRLLPGISFGIQTFATCPRHGLLAVACKVRLHASIVTVNEPCERCSKKGYWTSSIANQSVPVARISVARCNSLEYPVSWPSPWPLPHTWLFAWTRDRFLLGQGPRPQLHIYDCMAGAKPTADSPSTPASTKTNENGPGKTHAAPRELASLDPGMPLGAAALALSGDGERLAVLGRASGGNGGGEAAACGHGLLLRVYAWRTVSRWLAGWLL
jgi:hypothetical protein